MKTLGMFLGVVAVVALGIFGYQQYGTWKAGQLVKWRADSARVADDTRAKTLAAVKADTAFLTGKTVYVRGRDRVLHDTVHPPSADVRACYAAADSLLSLCAVRHAADSAVSAALRAELAVARAKPSERQKRFTLYGAGLYDLLNAAPVFRAGVDLRVLGGISGMAEGELAVPSAVQCQTGKCGVAMRALVGVRYVF